ncbi:rho GTPase-activating protein 7 [Hippocampus comes]|uniref:rho GTPase-activating protein 7 n=1 Tax=Hippocampus comes TaxID=109280 RepID=UPI00094E02EF|nr:PREDICTED: rho GTPase-activating protein 7-like [Hippocampus comes]
MAVKTPLRRSFSEHVKVSTNRAWDVFWRSVRERRLWEIEAKEACDWLQAAGFPQYAQLFKDCRFPIDVELAKRDHHFLDKDALDSLSRRLITLNKCAEMRLDLPKAKHQSDEDFLEDDFCAISPRWTHDRLMRQWRRLDSSTEFLHSSDASSFPQDVSLYDHRDDRHDVCSIRSSSSTESERQNRKSPKEGADPNRSIADDQATSRSSSRCSSSNKTPSLDMSFSGPPSPGDRSGGGSSTASLEVYIMDKPPRKKGTSLLRKMEKLRLRGTTGLLSAPRNHANLAAVARGSADGRGPSSCASSSPSSPHAMSSSSSNSHSESSSAVSTPSPVTRVRSNCKRTEMGEGVTRNNHHTGTTDNKDQHNNNNNNNNMNHNSLLFHIPNGHKPGTFPTSLAHKHAFLSPIMDQSAVNWRTGSFHGYQERRSCRRGTSSLDTSPSPPDHRLSVYDNVPDNQQLSESEGGSGGSVSDAERVGDEVSRLLGSEDVFSALDTVLERINDLQQLVSTWAESLSEDDCQRDSSSASSSASSCSPASGSSATSPCPSSPIHIHLEVQHSEEDEEGLEEGEEESCEKSSVSEDESKTRSPQDQSSRASQQLHWSSEQSLPSLPASPGVEHQSVSQFALLQKLALLKLTALMDKYSPSSKQGWSWSVPKTMVRKAKASPAKARRVFGTCVCVNVRRGPVSADFPKDQQLLAAQAAILLLPDENREALRTLLFFLRDVVACVDDNHMTPTNIAVCLAPSLFHLNALKRDAGSSHRKYSLGRPDQRDLSENLAATQGLADMISEAQRLFQIPDFWPALNLSSAAPTDEASEEELEETMQKLRQSTQLLIKEAGDKSRGWETRPAPEHVSLAVKKTWSGCPLWTWRVSVEVDASQEVLLRRLIEEERPCGGGAGLGAVIQTLGECAHVCRYLRQGHDAGLASSLPREHLLLRTWQSEATCGPLFVSSVSTQHPQAPPEGVRVHTHACLYLLEPAAASKTRLTHVCRTDTRGRSPAWNRKVSGHRMVAALLALKASFQGQHKENTM